MSTGDSFTVKEIVIEIRDTVKDLAGKVDKIGERGTENSSQIADHGRQLDDHEGRIDRLESWRDGLTAVATLKKWQVTVALGILGIFAGLIGSFATLAWLHAG
jgi:hypothetical protein